MRNCNFEVVCSEVENLREEEGRVDRLTISFFCH